MSPCATSNAARVFPSFDDRGTLNVGAPADVALMELREGTFEFLDNYKGTRTGGIAARPIRSLIASGAAPLNVTYYRGASSTVCR